MMVTLNGYDNWKLDTPDNGWHWVACEDAEGFFCVPCNLYIEPGLKAKNWCESCGKFAGRIDKCICEEIEYKIAKGI